MKVFCIFGDERVYRSRSPSMFTTVLHRMGVKGAYVPFMVQPKDIGRAMQSIHILNLAGANVTVPHKESVIQYLDVLSEGANIIGAINTVVRTGDQLKGYNTNAIGVMDALNHVGFDASKKTALVFGTGGAAKAVAFILNWLRTEAVYVAGRSRAKAAAVVGRFAGTPLALEDLSDQTPAAHIVVNATSVSSPEESASLAAVAEELSLSSCELLLDLNYGREKNFWKARAEKENIRFIDGLLPLAYQARRTFALWTGMNVPPEEFVKAVKENGVRPNGSA